MVSELIQDLDRNFGPNKRFQFTKVTFISKKESFLAFCSVFAFT